MPLHAVLEEDKAVVYASWLKQLIDAAGEVASSLRRATATALLPEGKDAPKDSTLLRDVETAFWADTAAGFHAMAEKLREALQGEAGPLPTEVAEGWLKSLYWESRRIFETYVEAVDLRSDDYKRVAEAEKAFRFFVSPRAAKLRKILELPELEPSPGAKTRKKGKKP